MNRTLFCLLKEIYNVLAMILLVISNDMNTHQAKSFNIYMGNIEAFLDELNDR